MHSNTQLLTAPLKLPKEDDFIWVGAPHKNLVLSVVGCAFVSIEIIGTDLTSKSAINIR